jgi:hypothetical protein
MSPVVGVNLADHYENCRRIVGAGALPQLKSMLGSMRVRKIGVLRRVVFAAQASADGLELSLMSTLALGEGW